jgi:hypothetical protein
MEERDESLPESLMHSAANDFAAGALVDAGESLLDTATQSVTDSDVLIKVPILGILAAMTKGFFSFKDRRYANKLLNFLAETSRASEEDKRRYREKLDSDPEESKRAGETILDITDKITSNEKAVMIGKVFRAYMHEDAMTLAQVIYLSEIIERAYLQDLVSIQRSELHNEANLENIGLKKTLRTADVWNLIDESLQKFQKQQDSDARLAMRGISTSRLQLPALQEPGWTDAGLELVRILRSYD